MKSRILRTFFIVLLLLCIAAWLESYKDSWGIDFQGRTYWSVQCNCGQSHMTWLDDAHQEDKGWHVYAFPAHPAINSAVAMRFNSNYWFGISIKTTTFGPMRDGATWISIPFWFPTTLSAALLWLVWRNTRPKAKGSAFPVELATKKQEP